MGDTWITDMSHFHFPDEKAHDLPEQAIRLAEYFASIIDATFRNAPLTSRPIGIRCRRRPGRRPCPGWIQAELHPDGDELYWQCPACGDTGRISNWKGTRWDPERKQIKSGNLFGPIPANNNICEKYEKIQGTIEWDEALQGALPKIVTGKRAYTWFELGQELMTYEGFRVDITIS